MLVILAQSSQGGSVTVTAPPRPPRPSDPVDREELEALVEALIEEARQRARRRRRRYAASVTLVALVGVAVFAVFGRARSRRPLPRRSPHGRASGRSGEPKIAFISEPLAWATRRSLGHEPRREWEAQAGRPPLTGCLVARRAEDRLRGLEPHATSDVYVMNADGSGKRKLTSDPGWDSSGLVARRTEDRVRR